MLFVLVVKGKTWGLLVECSTVMISNPNQLYTVHVRLSICFMPCLVKVATCEHF